MKPKEFEQLQLEKLKAIKDWNKDWPTANRMAPTVCVDCNRKLSKPSVTMKVLIKPCREFPRGLLSSSGKFEIYCKCGVVYVWSYPNIYLKTHKSMELMMHRYPSGELLYPVNC